MSLKERIAIVTGAGQGIGLGIARALATEGAHIVIGELVPERGEAAAKNLISEGHHAQAIPLDVSTTNSCSALVDAVLEQHKRIDFGIGFGYGQTSSLPSPG